MVDDDNSSEDEKEYQKSLEKLEKIRKAKEEAEKNGTALEFDPDSDDGEDSDYEYAGGDLALYDSALDKVDEL